MKLRIVYQLLTVLSFFFLFLPATSASEKVISSPATDFTLNDIHNTPHSLSDYKGSVVMVNFWASWCKECLEEMSSLDSLYTIYKKEGFVILGVSIDRDRGKVLKVTEQFPVSYPILIDKTGEVFINTFTVTKLPSSFIIDRNGLVVEKIIGSDNFTSRKYKLLIEKLLSGEVRK